MHAVTVTGFEAATNADVLNGTRLVTVLAGAVKIECQAADNVAANNFVASLTLPQGDAPWLAISVPAGRTAGLGGILDDDLALIGTFRVAAGHVTLSFTETGDTEVTWRVTNLTA